MSLEGDRLSVGAESVPLQDILLAFADRGIRVRSDPGINPRVTASFSRRPLGRALSSLFKSVNYVLVWKSVKGPAGPISVLAEIHVFRPGQKGLARPLQTPSGLAIVKSPDGTLFARDEVLLRLARGVTASQFQKLLSRIGATLIDSYPSLGIYRVLLPKNTNVPETAASLSKLSEVSEAAPNYAYPISMPYQALTNAEPYPPARADLGEQAPRVAVLDSGFQGTGGRDDFVAASLDAVHPDEVISDDVGHGTRMALIASGTVRPYGTGDDGSGVIPVIPVKAFDENGFTTDFVLMKSIDFSLEQGARVLSLSWGSENRSSFLQDTFDYASRQGLIALAAAGNEPTGKPVYPAAFPSVIGVGALGPDGSPWDKSNFGNFVNISAPGLAVFSAAGQQDSAAYIGTSVSTAYVANLFADYLATHPQATAEEILKAVATAQKK